MQVATLSVLSRGVDVDELKEGHYRQRKDQRLLAIGDFMRLLDVDWFDLELAFRDTTGTENHLDLETGEVVSVVPGFVDEDELRSLVNREKERLVSLPPLTATDARAFMADFVESLEVGEMRKSLKATSTGAGSLTRCVTLLRGDDAMLGRYYRFEQMRFWEHVEVFLTNLGVQATSRTPSVDLFEGIA
ncbi:MAG: hypothetical protein GY822_27675 [Deltaproteobacteria bacterium]|nr:hypothetical protein [Deltaproteobacteria bacterium]